MKWQRVLALDVFLSEKSSAADGITLFGIVARIFGFAKKRLVRVKGLEPPRLAAPEPKSGASTNSATPALMRLLTKPIRNGERKNATLRNLKM